MTQSIYNLFGHLKLFIPDPLVSMDVASPIIGGPSVGSLSNTDENVRSFFAPPSLPPFLEAAALTNFSSVALSMLPIILASTGSRL